MSWGKAGGKGKGGKGKIVLPNGDFPISDWGIPGFGEALREAMSPHRDMDPQWTLEDMEQRVGQKICKAAKTFWTDERVHQRGTAIQARIMVESLVETALASITSSCYEKPWLFKVNYSGPLLAIVLQTFQGGKMWTRTLAPAIEKYVEDAIFTWAEEERISKAIYAAVESAGVKESFQKRAVKYLQTAYDEAYFKAPYGTHTASTPEMGMLMDFVKGWMVSFAAEGYEVLVGGLGNGRASRDEQILFMTVLFQNLTAQECACLPHELTSLIEEPPPNPWPFIGQAVEATFYEVDGKISESSAKRFKGASGLRGGCLGKGSIDGWVPPDALPNAQAGAAAAAQAQAYLAAQQQAAAHHFAQQQAALQQLHALHQATGLAG